MKKVIIRLINRVVIATLLTALILFPSLGFIFATKYAFELIFGKVGEFAEGFILFLVIIDTVVGVCFFFVTFLSDKDSKETKVKS